MNNEIITMITCFVTNVVVSIFTIISDLLMNCHNYKPVKGSHNLKFIKLYFKYFIKEYGPGIPGIRVKTLQEAALDINGDIISGVLRFRFGKRKIKRLYVNIKQNTFIIL